ncbi:MAG: SMI1/KNR4 family protein [Clostridia bacterium]|nr:SMI1/KNR4 family protein [Clostridia bacterium]
MKPSEKISKDKPKPRLSKRTLAGIIVGSSVTAVCTVIIAISVYLISTDTTGDGYSQALLITGALGFIWGVIYLIVVLRKMLKERREQAQAEKREQALINLMASEEEIDYEGIDNEVEEFLKTAPLPEGFKEYLADDNGRCIIKLSGGESDFYEVAYRYPAEDLFSINFHDDRFLNYRYYMDDRKFIAFSDDESGHCHLILDYNEGGEPSVKFFDDEDDGFLPVADSFSEFLNKLKPKQEN